MNNEDLKNRMNLLLDELSKSENKKQDKMIIAKAVQLGITYEEEKIRQSIQNMFNNIYKDEI